MAQEQPAAPAMTAGQPDAPKTSKPSRRSIITRFALLVGIMVVVFVVILPRVVDYGAVFDAFSTLTTGQLAALAAATALAYVANAAPSRILIPGLSWPHAIGADLAGRAVVSTIPGPTDIATRFVLYRQWDIPADTATAGIVFNAFFETGSDLVLPLIATIGVLLAGHTARPTVVVLSLVGVAVLVVTLVVLAAIVRSESLAGRLGRALDSIAKRVWPLFRKTPPTGIVEGVMQVRERAHDILSRRGALAFVAAVLARLAWFLVLQISLWSVGVTSEVLPPSAVLTAMAAVTLVSLIPITPGAVGVSEVAYIGLLSSVAGDGMTGPITAAIVIFRAAQWFVPIPLGWILLVIMRGSHWRELEAEATPAPAGEPAAEPSAAT
jgi:putative heme transporter